MRRILGTASEYKVSELADRSAGVVLKNQKTAATSFANSSQITRLPAPTFWNQRHYCREWLSRVPLRFVAK